ncbi:unnamed protein product [Rhizopus microsporus]
MKEMIVQKQLKVLTFCINSTNDVQNEPGQDEEELSPEIDLPSDNTMSIISPNIKPCAVVSHSVPSTGVADSLSGDDADNAVLYACQQMDVDDTEKSKTLYISSTKGYRCFL